MNDQKQLISSLGEEMTIRQKRTMIFFIEATKHILQEDGYDHLTIREIAQRAGYNAATLYHYFRDLDELIIYGSVGFLSDYVRLLACRIKHSMTALQKYQTIYACFNEVAFVWPVCSIICSSETIMLIWDKSSAPTTRSFILRNFKKYPIWPCGKCCRGEPFLNVTRS